MRLEPGSIHDGGEVTVRGSNLVAGAFVSVHVCGKLSEAPPGASTPLCERRMYTGTVDHSGSLSITVTLRKRVTGFLLNASPDPEFDCAALPCSVNVNINNGRGYSFRFQFGDDDVTNVGQDPPSAQQ